MSLEPQGNLRTSLLKNLWARKPHKRTLTSEKTCVPASKKQLTCMEHEASTSPSFKDNKLVIMKPNESIIINLAISLKGEAEHIFELKAVQILAPGKALKLFTSNSFCVGLRRRESTKSIQYSKKRIPAACLKRIWTWNPRNLWALNLRTDDPWALSHRTLCTRSPMSKICKPHKPQKPQNAQSYEGQAPKNPSI